MAEDGRSVNDWLKISMAASALFIQTGGLVYFQATKSAEVQGKVELVGQSVANLREGVAEFKTDMKTNVGELRADVKDISSLGLKVNEIVGKVTMLERRLELLEDREKVIGANPAREK